VRTWFHWNRSRHRVLRVGVFCFGLILILLGGALWLVSMLFAAPLMFAGLWVWSREFHWGHRLFTGFLKRLRALWSRVRARPVRWTVITVCGIASAAAAYWAWGHFGLPGSG